MNQEEINQIDIKFNNAVLHKYMYKMPAKLHALDVAAGVGRITKELLLPNGFKHVDLLEQSSTLMASARKKLAKQIPKQGKARSFFEVGMQDFNFMYKYDCIWINWGIGYLNKEDAVIFVKKCSANLRKVYPQGKKPQTGYLFIKENINDASNSDGFDSEQCQFIRTRESYEEIFKQADMIVEMSKQQEFRNGLHRNFPTVLWVLSPKTKESWDKWGS